jgi:hypothetical protein
MNKLSNGEFGLSRTVWLYTVLPCFVTNTISKFLPIEIGLAMLIPISIYMIYIIPGIWKSANNYDGKLKWAPSIAKAYAVLTVIMTIWGFSSLIYVYALINL